MAAESNTTSVSAKVSKKREHPEDLPVSVSAKKSSIQLQREKLQALVKSNVEKGLVAPSMQMPPKKKAKLESGPSTSELSSTSNTTKLSNVHSDLNLLKQLVYEPAGLKFSSKPTKDSECEEYAGCSFSLNERNVKFRVAKTTPTKNGQFVTFWKRIGKGPIMPFDAKDPIDLFVVCVRQKERFGQFVFPKTCFQAEKILSTNGKGGKRAIRVYAPWVKTDSKQAASTQSWQSKYFADLSGGKADLQRIKLLYSK